METLKLLLAAFEFPPYPLAGTGQYAVNLVKGLKGHNITFVTAAHGKSGLEGLANIVQIGRPIGAAKANRSIIDRKTLFSLSLRKYLKTVRLEGFDLFHSITLRDAAFLDYNYLRGKIPSVISVNDYYILGASWNIFKFHYKSSDLMLRYLHHNLLKTFQLRALRGCQKIIANAGFTKSILIANGLPAEKVGVVRRGINTQKFDVPAGKNKYASQKVLFVGPNMERKGATYLIEAAPEILKQFPNAKFTIVGDASRKYMNKLGQFLAKNGISDRFEFIRHLNQDSLLPHYSDANVFVMPSIIEALGQVYMEAMMAQTPVIGADVGGVSEIITPEVGFLVKPMSHKDIAEKVISILSDARLAAKMGAAGKERIKTYFSNERMVSETISAYKKTAESWQAN